MMASVPSIMIWDDHDIVDGWGSYPESLQSSEVFQHIFATAKRYFSLIQARTSFNSALFGTDHFSQHVSFRNYEIMVLDNRSYRTANNVMSEQQYDDLATELNAVLFKNIPVAIAQERVLCFLLPVPIAHINYASIVERIFDVFT